MDILFLQIINMSITSSYIILIIMAIRLFLKRLPKILSYGLWLVGFLRLIFPFPFTSIYSLISINTKTIPDDIIYAKTPEIQSGIKIIDSAINEILPPATSTGSINPIQVWIGIGSAVWIVGLILLLIYSIVTSLKFAKQLKSADLLYDNIYQLDKLETAFVFGLIKPKIYLPSNLSQPETSYIIEHEKTHIERKDHIIKFIAFIITSIHWFNPLVWLGFYLMSEDMELSCDEAVIEKMGFHIKKDYSNSLLALSIKSKTIGGSPLAFGENNVKSRIKNILNYKRPEFWLIALLSILFIFLLIGLLSNPHIDQDSIYSLEGKSEHWEASLDDQTKKGRIIADGYLTYNNNYPPENIEYEIVLYGIITDDKIEGIRIPMGEIEVSASKYHISASKNNFSESMETIEGNLGTIGHDLGYIEVKWLENGEGKSEKIYLSDKEM